MDILEFDGTFTLAFLLDDEKVRSDGNKGIEIINNKDEILAKAQKGDVLIRQNDLSIHVLPSRDRQSLCAHDSTQEVPASPFIECLDCGALI